VITLSRARIVVACGAVLLLASGCGNSESTPADTGTATDTGTASDTGTATDTGTSTDAVADTGTAMDAADEPDAAPEDAGEQHDAAPEDAGPVECTDLAPTGGTDGDLIISEVSPGNHIGLFNPTDADIDLSTSTYQLCQMPAYAGISGAGTVPAKGYLLVSWPGNFGTSLTGDEVALYANATFTEGANIVDFVCWGTGRLTNTRKALAEGADHWGGGCVGALTLGQAVIRLPETDGKTAESYTLGTAPALECTP
jgi:hypothetical protein